MGQKNTTPETSTYVLGRGKLFFSEIGSDGLPIGYRLVGNCPEITGTVESENYEHFRSTSGLKQKGNRIISVMGARNKDLLFWEDELCSVSDQLTVTTDDGSYGRKGVVTEPLKELLDSDEKIDRVIAIGPSIMMKFCAITTAPFGVKTIVSLNPIMVDGTGMCGCCRVAVGGETKFACVDGPDFDGHQVDWDLLLARQRIYLDEEKRSLEQWQCECSTH